MRVVTVTYVSFGMVFGSFDVSMVAFATARHHPDVAGPLLALIALGSAVGGLWYGGRRWQAPLADRFAVACVTLAACAVPLVLASSLAAMALAALVTGLAIAPSLIVSAVLTERLVPADALAEGLGLLGGSIGVGFALGAPLAGHLVDTSGARAAFFVAVAAAGAAALVTVAGRRSLAAPAVAVPATW
jgi:MFS family permease